MTTTATPIAELVLDAADRNPEGIALISGADRTSISYGVLAAMIHELATQLSTAGLEPGDRAALRAPSGPAFVVGLLAASRAGLVAVPLDPALPDAEQLARINACGARVALIGGEVSSAFACWPISVDTATGHAHLDTTTPAAPAIPGPDDLQADDALIMFTGGTTGTPKMVPWTHDNVASSVRAVIDTYSLSPADSTVAAMPLFHGHGLIATLLSTLASGGTVLVPASGRFSAHTFADDLLAADATWFTAVPTIHQILIGRSAAGEAGSYAGRLRFTRSCSATLSAETAAEMQTLFGAPTLSAYGMTEATHQISSSRGEEVTTGLVGASTGPEIRIADDNGQPCPPESVGEIWLRGHTIVRGYLANPKATEQTFTDGWLRTGDLGSLARTGELTLRGRIKELINRAGEKISPERVEGMLVGHPQVIEAAVFGVPDALYEEKVAAVIVPDPSAPPTAAELTEFCRARLAAFEIPDTIELADALPHTAKGSVDRRAIAAQFGKPAAN